MKLSLNDLSKYSKEELLEYTLGLREENILLKKRLKEINVLTYDTDHIQTREK